MHFINNFIKKYVLCSGSELEGIEIADNSYYDDNDELVTSSLLVSDLDSSEYNALLDYRNRYMTNLAYQIGNLLLPVCLEETRKARELYSHPPEPPFPPLLNDLKLLLLRYEKDSGDPVGSQLMRDYTVKLIELLGKLEDAKLLKTFKFRHDAKNILPVYTPFTVIVITAPQTRANELIADVPRIVIHGKNRTTLWLDDEPKSAYNFETTIDQTRVATDEEVENCVMSLSPNQLRTVMTHELFAPIVNALYEDQTELIPMINDEPLKEPIKKDSNEENDDVPYA